MFAENIKELAKENENFRKVLKTGVHSQLVVMSLLVGEDIGAETHNDVDQIFYFVKGKCEAMLDGETKVVEKHSVVFVPAGVHHNFKNVGDENLKLFTIYSPPQHPDGTIHATKADAEKSGH